MEPHPRKHHLDRRADQLVAQGAEGPQEELLSTVQLAGWLGCSVQWCEIGRSKGYGPPFLRLGRRIRYRRRSVLQWLKSRTHNCTAEYRQNLEAE